jgi:hypothetical protein
MLVNVSFKNNEKKKLITFKVLKLYHNLERKKEQKEFRTKNENEKNANSLEVLKLKVRFALDLFLSWNLKKN